MKSSMTETHDMPIKSNYISNSEDSKILHDV